MSLDRSQLINTARNGLAGLGHGQLGVPLLLLATLVTVRSAAAVSVVAAVTVLFAVVLSGVVVATPAVQPWTVVEPAGTVKLTSCRTSWPS